MSIPSPRIGSPLLLMLALGTSTSSAGWSPNGATIRSTTTVLPEIVACNDGAFGAIVIWQEPMGGGPSELRAQHVLPTGDLDPTWPASGAVICTVSVDPQAMGILPDGLNGAYLWWMEGTSVRLTRLGPDGNVVAGWPADGRFIAALLQSSDRVDVSSDGASGVYITWRGPAANIDDPHAVYLTRLGPDNTGWTSPRNVSGADPTWTLENWPQVALAPDGGAFVAWVRSSWDTTVTPHGWRLKRVTSSGLTAPGWPPLGMELRRIESAEAYAGTWPRIDITPDRLGGIFTFIVHQFGPSGFDMDARVYEFQGDGTPHPQWMLGGNPISNVYVALDVGPDGAVRVYSDGLGGALVGVPQYSVHWPSYLMARVTAAGPGFAGKGVLTVDHVETALSGNHMFTGAVIPSGPYQPYTPCAFLALHSCPGAPGWTAFSESHCEPVLAWYGDIALAPTGDGGVFFFWSQHRERFGLFGRRFNAPGEVVSVTQPPDVWALQAIFRPGSGVIVTASFRELDAGRIDLYDVTGRRRAHASFGHARGPIEVLLEGTSRLESGVYFLKLEAGDQVEGSRIAILR